MSPARAWTGAPESQSSIGPVDGKYNVQRHRFAAAGARRPDLGGQLRLDALELVHVHMDDFGAVQEVECRIMAVEAAARLKIAAAKDIGGLVQVDIALDIRRNAPGRAVGIVGDQ